MAGISVYTLLWVCSCILFVKSQGDQRQWEHVQPAGCLRGEEAKGRWCEVHADGSVTIRIVNRLKDLIKTSEKKIEEGKGVEGLDSEVKASWAVLKATSEADTKYETAERKRLKDLPAGTRKRSPSQYRCRKNKKTGWEIENLEYKCTVTDYKLSKKEDVEPAGEATTEVSDVDRCEQLLTWQSKFKKDSSDGKQEFFAFLAKNHDGIGDLEKLKSHSAKYGIGTGKVADALETKATKTYKKISKEMHPDKQVKFFRNAPRCEKEKAVLVEMLKAIFDRAADLKSCIMKPLRCELPDLNPRKGINEEL
ncbi:hypothetical protein CYMTET_8767 [Cymbomonas tetramitiformis]|uniref:J domain-containing protein n=1 Tax=Cymbomonas tetramitiformis TaxID=36881 RepID=A0AAE0LG61_9CHLO|nr:hypothetical protein CYMTET_8767 [Cymbomonas tetramitiformis]